jgi:glycosyltransferase involved in cell wall biosynthesis
MKVSIITVTYNSSKYLGDCIDSVVKQQYGNIEHIVVDGGSTDDTVAIIKRYESHIAKWVSEKDEGMYDAINKGMKMATGDVIGILNSDDILVLDDIISAIADSFIKYNVDSVYGDLTYVDQKDLTKILRFWKGGTYNRNRFVYGWMPAHPTFYLRRELVEKYGGYESHYFTAADYEFMSRYLYFHHISAHYLPKLVVKMRIGGASNGNLFRRLRANRRDYLAMRKNQVPFPFLASVLKPLIKLHQYYYTLSHKLK